MKRPLPACVVDASVGIQLFITDTLSEQAESFFRRIVGENPTAFFAPTLFDIECANVLWKHVRSSRIPALQAELAIGQVRQLAIERIPTSDLLAEALPIAILYDISVYDACYVTLASRLIIPLITVDGRLVAKMQGSGYIIKHLTSIIDTDR